MRSKLSHYCFIVLLLIIYSAGAFALTGDEIIRKVDENLTFNTARFEAKMMIYVGDEVREKRFTSFAEGNMKSFAEFTYPARDKGVKYLKIGDRMWMWLPSVEKVIKIEGHMLRQSMMGSDFSYEDALESGKLLEKYTTTLLGKEKVKGRTAHVLELVAKVKDVTYFKRKLWVDEATFIPLKEELYAKSGKLLKVSETQKIDVFGKRHYPTRSVLRNMLRRNSRTEFIMTDARFDIALPAGTFTERNLSK